MKRLRFLALCCCGILLSTFPVNAQQVWQYSPDSLTASYATAWQPSSHQPDRPFSTSSHSEQQIKAPSPYLPASTHSFGNSGHSAGFFEPFANQKSTATASDQGSSDRRPFDQVIKGSETLAGLFTLYRNSETGKTYLEIKPDQLDKNFLCVTTLASGVGERGLYRGWPLRDFPFQFRRVNDSVQFVIPNTYFRTDRGDPQEQSAARSFSDSVLYSLKIQSIHSQRQSLLVDLDELFLGNRDLAGLSTEFPWIFSTNYSLESNLSYLSEAKAFPLNIEVGAVYNFAGSSTSSARLDTLPDASSFNLNVRYSLSQLPTDNGYRPRLADDRLGYFITAYQNLSNRERSRPFVRYVQRWQLEKQDSDQALSLPKKPIVFWIENTVPDEYRDAIREGALLWNAAFERAGFRDAIEVKQMPDDADWDPADVRYNTIRWSNSFRAGVMAIGPSRVNPLTGQILDADILIDANAVRILQDDAGALVQNSQAPQSAVGAILGSQMCQPRLQQLYTQWLTAQSRQSANASEHLPVPTGAGGATEHDICFGMESAQQLSFGSLSLAMSQNLLSNSDVMRDYVHQYLRYLTAHEVGHTLGLRHNFRGSTMLSPEELNNTEITHTRGMVGSVMDYTPVNLAPHGMEQGDYFPVVLGPYDHWAIAYGYTAFDPTQPQAEIQGLQEIARRSAEPGLAYATDEDSFNAFDPAANVWDLSSNMLNYTQWQLDNAQAIWERLGNRYPLPGESYTELRDRFDSVFYYYVGYAMSPARYVGGQTFNRDRRSDSELASRLPFEPVPADQQRQALNLLRKYVFSADAFQFSPELINQLAPSRWEHWGASPSIFRLDYPIYDNIQSLQTLVLSDLLSSERLAEVRDAELRTQPGQALTLPELFNTLQTDIWSEILNAKSTPTISSLRRGVQSRYLDILVNMTLRRSTVENANTFLDFIVAFLTANPPEDARVLARYHLRQLNDAIGSTLRRHDDHMDIATVAHLEDAHARIAKALEAEMRSE